MRFAVLLLLFLSLAVHGSALRGAKVSEDGLQVQLQVEGLVQGHVHDFDLGRMQSAEGGKLVHTKAYYTLNEIPVR